MTLCHVGLGSNVDRTASVRKALALLRDEHDVVAISPVYESPAEGMDSHPFLNCVVAIETPLTPETLRERLKDLEVACGRPRDHESWAPRTLDADLLLHGDAVREDLAIPDPDILTGPWVLVPLTDIAPDLAHPVEGCTLSDLLADRPGWRERLAPRTI
jgi:2-amino-4-hydroxy-6-hydroxymethyldihydropteridine diphosphokinase